MEVKIADTGIEDFRRLSEEEFESSMELIINYYKGNLKLSEVSDMERFVIEVIEKSNPEIVREFKLIALEL